MVTAPPSSRPGVDGVLEEATSLAQRFRTCVVEKKKCGVDGEDIVFFDDNNQEIERTPRQATVQVQRQRHGATAREHASTGNVWTLTADELLIVLSAKKHAEVAKRLRNHSKTMKKVNGFLAALFEGTGLSVASLIAKGRLVVVDLQTTSKRDRADGDASRGQWEDGNSARDVHGGQGSDGTLRGSGHGSSDLSQWREEKFFSDKFTRHRSLDLFRLVEFLKSRTASGGVDVVAQRAPAGPKQQPDDAIADGTVPQKDVYDPHQQRAGGEEVLQAAGADMMLGDAAGLLDDSGHGGRAGAGQLGPGGANGSDGAGGANAALARVEFKFLEEAGVQRVAAALNPIIVVPGRPAWDIVGTSNVRSFLLHGAVDKADDEKNGDTVFVRRPSPRHGGRMLQFEVRVVGSLADGDWSRVVAAIVRGKKWEFNKWKWRNPRDALAHVQGFYFHRHRSPVPADVKQWSVVRYAINATTPAETRAATRDFWERVDQLVDVD